MTEKQYFSLCEKYLNGLCTPDEELLLVAYQEKNNLTSLGYTAPDADRIKQELQNRIQQSIKKTTIRPVQVKLLRWGIAASVAAGLFLVLYLGTDIFKNDVGKPVMANIKRSVQQQDDILHPEAGAILTLSTGESITLDDAKNGVISKQNNAAIAKSEDGLVVSAKMDTKNPNNQVLNKITIPRGGKYKITLPDGTQVWLNSSSSLSFPTAFYGNERKVMLTGEAYFEVAKNKNMPFKVDVAGKQEVEVLGTHFNISAFPEDSNIMTTLLEGSVNVNTSSSKVLIKPGEMVVNNLKNKLAVVPADIEEVMAWKNDMFIFNNENITSIMKKISRWYDVEIDYQGNMKGINFDGNYSRVKGLKSLLKNIELTDKVNFVIAERRITVIAK
ncbi:FecR family protein [Pedobacter frigiditerrae]|uniref:FecR family protein n=1 Tax=Pedobacter frigiditerrae TaxID=2530452 RepID=A0A4V2MHV0_9SPHI|nr:FecR family protein [Pedobacter frigiditerrae]TCC87956.1 FecR family protein [Pedobacter frigiditerrae]